MASVADIFCLYSSFLSFYLFFMQLYAAAVFNHMGKRLTFETWGRNTATKCSKPYDNPGTHFFGKPVTVLSAEISFFSRILR